MTHRLNIRILLTLVLGCVALLGRPVMAQSPPAAPSDLTLTGLTYISADFEWQDNSSNETGFQIELQTEAGPWELVGGTPADTTSGGLGGLIPETTYSVRVRAVNPDGVSAPTNEITFTTPSAPEAAGSLKIAPPQLYFGTVRVGRTAERQLHLVNRGPGVLYLFVSPPGALDPDSAFTVVDGAGFFILQPGERLTVRIAFTATDPGREMGAIRIRTNDPDNRQIFVPLTATAR